MLHHHRFRDFGVAFVRALFVIGALAYTVSSAGADPVRKFRGGDFGNIWQLSVVFRIAQNHGEKSYFLRF